MAHSTPNPAARGSSAPPRSAGGSGTSPSSAERLARRLRPEALDRGDAVLVGTRAGVVEWTDGAWTRLTGFPLDETIGKPIGHFLDHAGLERELVEFVAQHFLEGRGCTVALPFDTFDGRRIDAQLDVEAWHDASGEIARFIAVARETRALGRETGAIGRGLDALDRETRAPVRDAYVPGGGTRDAGPTPAAERSDPSTRATQHASEDVCLRSILEAAVGAAQPRLAHAAAIDLHVVSGADAARAPARALRAVLDALLEASAESARVTPAWVSMIAGPLRAGRSHHSLVHPVPNRALARRGRDGRYVEVHDTGEHLDEDALARLTARAASRPGDSDRERALGRALALADDAGLALCLDSTAGCGTQALIVLKTT